MAKRKPRPGSLPRAQADAHAEPEPLHPAQLAVPPWPLDKRREKQREKTRNTPHGIHVLTALAKARKQAEELAGELRDVGFEDWVRRCVQEAERPDEWTQARKLYENYLAHVKTRNVNRAQRKLLAEEAATETQWGRMMATCFTKKRKTAGWYYPLRCKRGA